MFIIILTLLIVLALLLYKWSVSTYQTFAERGVFHEKPTPLLGNIPLKDMMGTEPHVKKQIENHMKFRDHKIYGLYLIRDPIFILRNVELVKNVIVKDFDHFMNHTSTKAFETQLSNSLVQLKDRKWKDMRHILTPTFTGKKMRSMYELINVCSEMGVQYIEKEMKENGEIELELKDYFTRFTNDVIASAAFGIKVNSFNEKENEFFKFGQELTNVSNAIVYKALIKALFIYLMPRVMKALKISLIDDDRVNYFKKLVFDAIKYREEHKIIRPDMIHLLMEAQRPVDNESSEEKRFSDDDLLSQCLLFFFAGFDTVSTCLCFVTYELCINPDVQSQLYEEILAVEKQLQGKPLDYDTLTHMKYLDMVISEGLRKWPPATTTDRQCTADIDLRDENNEFVVSLKKGDKLFIPILGSHYDPEHFAEPEKFKPERFSDENKHEIKPFTYLPFGLGPRSCIGNRMALMEVKSIIYHMLTKFQLVPAEKTAKDMMNSIVGFAMKPKDGFWIKFVPREAK